MNKIYKLVWSKVRNTWVVASEIAKGHGKSSSSEGKGIILKSMILMALFGSFMTAGMSPVAAEETSEQIQAQQLIDAIRNDESLSRQLAASIESSFLGDGNGNIKLPYLGISTNSPYLQDKVAVATGGSSIALGYGSNANTLSVAIGAGSLSKLNASALGYDAKANDFATALGMKSNASGQSSIAIGAGARGYDSPDSATSSSYGSIAIGTNSKVETNSDKAISIGLASKVTSDAAGAVALGVAAKAEGKTSIVIGAEAHTFHGNSIAIGSNTETLFDGTTALGKSAKAYTAGGVALGSYSEAKRSKGTKGDNFGDTSVDLTSSTWKSTSGVVAIGGTSNDITRQLTGLAAGSEDTDAVNVAQLKVVNAKVDKAAADITTINDKIKNLTTNTGEGAKYYSVQKPKDAATEQTEEQKLKDVDETAFGGGNAYKKLVDPRTTDGLGKEEFARYQDDYALTENNEKNGGARKFGDFAAGYGAYANGEMATATGYKSTAISHSTANGAFSFAEGGSYAGGYGATATLRSVSLGLKSHAAADAVSVGNDAKSHGAAVAIGGRADATKGGGVAVGFDSKLYGENSVAVGQGARGGKDSVSIGHGAYTEDKGTAFDQAVAVGFSASATGDNGVAMGAFADARNKFATAVGNAAIAQGQSSSSFGTNAKARADHSVAIGNTAEATKEAANAVVVGTSAKATAENTLAAGAASKALGTGGTAVGVAAEVSSAYGAAVGIGAKVEGTMGAALGAWSVANQKKALALGYGAEAKVAGGAALGADSVATTAAGEVGYTIDTEQAKKLKEQAVLAAEYDTLYQAFQNAPSGSTEETEARTKLQEFKTQHADFMAARDELATWRATDGAVSVGDSAKHKTRQITNLAAGTKDTDAVNVAQLKALNTKVDQGAIHYFSVKSDDKNTPDGTNWKNDGATGEDAIAIGRKARAYGMDSQSMGENAWSIGNYSQAWGYYALAGAEEGIDKEAYDALSDAEKKNYTLREMSIGGVDKSLYYRTTFKEYTNDEFKALSEQERDDLKSKKGYGFDSGKKVWTPTPRAIAIGHLSKALGAATVAVGNLAEATGIQSTAIGTQANASGSYSFAAGDRASAQKTGTIAIGMKANASGEWSTAIGSFAEASGKWGTALGLSAKAQSENGVALGASASVDKKGAASIGYKAKGNVENGVALGAYSVADREKGKIGYALGADNSTVEKVLESIGQKAKYDELTGKIDPLKDEYNGLVKAYQDAPSNSAEETTAKQKLDEWKAAHPDFLPAVKEKKQMIAAWQSGNGAVSVGSAGASRQITNVAAGSEDSDAVNVAQLKAVNKKVDKNAADITTINTDIKTLKGVSGKVIDGTNTTVEVGDENGTKTYKVNVAANGQIADGNTGIVTGDTVYKFINPISTKVSTMETTVNNLKGGFTIKGATSGTADITLGETTKPAITFKAETKDDDTTGVFTATVDDQKNVTYTLNTKKLKDKMGLTQGVGSMSSWKLKAGTTDAESITDGNEVEFAVAEANKGLTVKREGKKIQYGIDAEKLVTNINSATTKITNVDGDKINISNNESIKNINNSITTLKGVSGKVIDGTNTTVEVGDENGTKTYKVNVAANGQIADGNTGIVTGDTVYKFVNPIKNQVTNIESTVNNLKGGFTIKGATSGTADITLGETTKPAITFKAETKDDDTTGVFTAKVDADKNVTYTLNTKKLKEEMGLAQGVGSMSSWNLTATGDTKSEAIADGNTVEFAVAEANKGLTVKREGKKIQYGIDAEKLVTNINSATTKITNVDGDKINISNNESIKNINNSITTLKGVSGKVIDGTNTTVEVGDENGTKTYKVNVAANGQIADGNTGIVTGDTVYKFINPISMKVSTMETTVNNLKGGFTIKGATSGTADITLGETTKPAITFKAETKNDDTTGVFTAKVDADKNVTYTLNTKKLKEEMGLAQGVGSMSSWKLKATGGTAETIADGDEVEFEVETADKGLTVKQVGKKIQYGIDSDKLIDNINSNTTKKITNVDGSKIDISNNTSIKTINENITNLTGKATKVTVDGKEESTDGNLKLTKKTEKGQTTYDLSLNDELTIGKAGKDGKIGINGKDGSADITVGKGEAGVDGKDGITRIIYKDQGNKTHEVATLDDGLKFKGDNDDVVIRKLNTQLNITGGAKAEDLSDDNIGVVGTDGDNGGMTVKLSKKLKGLTSAEFVDGDNITNITGGNVTITRKEGNTTNKVDLWELNKTVNNITAGTTDVSSWKLQANGANDRTIKKNSIVNFTNGTATKVTVKGNDVTVDLNDATKKQINDNTTDINNMKNDIKNIQTTVNNIDTKIEQKIEGSKIKVEGDDKTGIKVKEDKVNGKVKGYKVSLDEKVKVGNVAIDGKDGKGEITGLTNTTVDATDFATKGRAATEEQLKAAMGKVQAQSRTTVKGSNNITVTPKTPNAAEYTVGLAKDISVDSVTAKKYKVGDKTYISDKGINANKNKITNVADGVVSKDSKDAVNGSQLFATNRQVLNNMNQINNLREESREGDALGAAMAALKPIGFDPYQRSQVMAGVGYYRGKEAVALGLAHYKNEDLMFHGGLAYAGNSELMANIGVTYRFGSKDDRDIKHDRNLRMPQYAEGPISSVYILQDEVDRLTKENKEAKDRIDELEAKLEKVLAKVK